MDFPILDMSYQWNCMTRDLVYLVSFTERLVFEVHLHCSVYGTPLLFMAKRYSIACISHILLRHPSVDCHLGGSHLLTFVKVLVSVPVFILWLYT